MPTTTTTQVPFRTVNRVGIRYADRGGSQKPAVVLTNPAGERVRVRADLGLAVRARSPLTGQPGVSAITASLSGRPHRRPAGSGAHAPDRGHQVALRTGTVTGRTYPPRRPG